jgi:hypothetical protein
MEVHHVDVLCIDVSLNVHVEISMLGGRLVCEVCTLTNGQRLDVALLERVFQLSCFRSSAVVPLLPPLSTGPGVLAPPRYPPYIDYLTRYLGCDVVDVLPSAVTARRMLEPSYVAERSLVSLVLGAGPARRSLDQLACAEELLGATVRLPAPAFHACGSLGIVVRAGGLPARCTVVWLASGVAQYDVPPQALQVFRPASRNVADSLRCAAAAPPFAPPPPPSAAAALVPPPNAPQPQQPQQQPQQPQQQPQQPQQPPPKRNQRAARQQPPISPRAGGQWRTPPELLEHIARLEARGHGHLLVS